MSDEYTTKRELVEPTTREISLARGIYGAIESYSKRKAADRVTKQLESAVRAVEMAKRFATATAELSDAETRMSPENLKKIAADASADVQASMMRSQMKVKEIELQTAELDLKKLMFNDEAAIRRRRLQTEALQAEAEYRAAYKAVHGEEAATEESVEEKRARLEAERDEVIDAISKLASEYVEAAKEGTLDEAAESTFARKNNDLIDKLNALETELAML